MWAVCNLLNHDAAASYEHVGALRTHDARVIAKLAKERGEKSEVIEQITPPPLQMRESERE